MRHWTIFPSSSHIQAVAGSSAIHQQLMAVPGNLQLRKIFSHPQAVAQGRNLLSIIQMLARNHCQYSLRCAMFLNILINHCGDCSKKSCREYSLFDCSRYSRNGSQFYSLWVWDLTPQIPLSPGSEKMSLASTL